MKRMIMTMAVALGCVAGALADVSFAYQGNLRDEFGDPKSNKTLTVTIRLYDKEEGGACFWATEMSAQTSADGTFNIEVADKPGRKVGDVVYPFLKEVIAEHPSFFLELDIGDSSGPIVPRQKVIAVPQALFAQDVREASGDFSVKGCASFHGGLQFKNVDGAARMCTLSDGVVNSTKMISTESRTDSMEVTRNITVGQDAVVKRDVEVSGDLTVGGPKVTANAAAMTVKSLAVTSADLTVNGMSVAIPVGMITLWYGAENAVPNGWAICNGQVVNGVQTPDLTGRFIVGAGQTVRNGTGTGKANDGGAVYQPMETGGERKHTLSIGEMPKHSHTSTMHTGDIVASWKDARNFFMPWAKYGATSDVTSSEAGNGDPHENLPPYCALFYIMKVR